MLIAMGMILLNATHEWSGKIHLASNARDWDDLWEIMKARLFAVLFTHQGKCDTRPYHEFTVKAEYGLEAGNGHSTWGHRLS